MLNSRLFSLKKTFKLDEESKNYEYSIWVPKGNPMILFSKDYGTPIASLHFEPQHHDSEINTLITGRPDKDEEDDSCQHFQGIINKDNQEFQLTISNLLDKGLINFNILKDNSSVMNVNPGGVNQVNELRPYESYSVKCDQEDNKSLILKSITKSDSESHGQAKLTVGEDEKNSNSYGTNLFLSVVPQQNIESLKEIFENTVWKTVDYFYTRKKINMSVFHSIRRGIYFENFEDDLEYDEVVDEENPGYEVEEEYVPHISSLFNQIGGDDSDDEIDHNEFREKFNIKQKNSMFSNIVDKTYASKIEKGDYVHVASCETGIDYVYELNSTSCKLGLSVYDKLELIENEYDSDKIEEEIDEIIKEIQEGKFKDFIDNNNIFKSDTCLISMDDEPNVIFYTCGHMCVNWKSIIGYDLDKCPMCRKKIKSMIKVEKDDDGKLKII